MSNSLTINVPKIVQTRNTLNAVPSGSTAEPDYNVKFVPQTLTEEQQAQARQNIGAGTSNFSGNYNDLSNKPTIPAAQVQSDWNQSDSAAPDYIKNKPTSLGGSAPELDEYFTIYPLGNTTLSAEAGTIDEVWLNGEEITATEDSYSISAGAVARVKATNNVCFNFSNTTDEIWIYVPKGIVLSEPIYGVRENINLVYWNISKDEQTMNFGGYVWIMTNVLFNGMFSTSNHTTFVMSGDTLDYTDVTGVSEANFTSVMYVTPKAGQSLPRNTYHHDHRVFPYENIIQKGYKLNLKIHDMNEDQCLQIIYSNINQNVRRVIGNIAGFNFIVYQNGLPFKYNPKATADNQLNEGEFRYETASPWNARFKPWNPSTKGIGVNGNKSVFYVKFLTNANDWNRWNFADADACQGIILPTAYRLPNGDSNYCLNKCDFSALNNTFIYPAIYDVANAYHRTYAGGTFTKIVLMNKTSYSVDIPNTCTEAIVTWESVPSDVNSCWQKQTLTKIWMPRATYDLAIVDSNWSAYASKLFPYDELTFGPNNYVEPVVDEFTHNNNMQTQRLKSWVEIFINQDLDICLFRNEGWGLYDENLGKCSKNFPSTLMINGVEHKNDIEFGRQQEDDPEYVKWINFPIKAGRNLIGSVYNDMEIPNLNAVDSQDILSTCEIWAYIMDSSDDFLRSDILGNTASLNVVMLQTCDGLYSNVTGSLGYQEGSNVWHWIFQDGNGTGQDGNHFYEFYGNFVYGAATFDNIPSTEITDSDFHCHFYVRQSSYNDFLTAMASKAPNISQAAIIAATTQYDYLEPYGGYKWRMVMPA